MRGALRCVVLAAVLVTIGGAAALWLVTRSGFSARDQPSAVEVWAARALRGWGMPRSYREMKNPEPVTEEGLARARAHFADHCASCHGNDGLGQTTLGRNMYPKSPDMTLAATQKMSDGAIFYTIKHGVRLTGMPAWGEDTPQHDKDSWELVHFIRRLPQITQEELSEMESLNPKSPAEFRREEEERRFLEGGEPSSSGEAHH